LLQLRKKEDSYKRLGVESSTIRYRRRDFSPSDDEKRAKGLALLEEVMEALKREEDEASKKKLDEAFKKEQDEKKHDSSSEASEDSFCEGSSSEQEKKRNQQETNDKEYLFACSSEGPPSVGSSETLPLKNPPLKTLPLNKKVQRRKMDLNQGLVQILQHV
jgi:hypothetical protein